MKGVVLKNDYPDYEPPKVYDEPVTRVCEICGEKFQTRLELAKACKKCTGKENGLFFARWWLKKNHPSFGSLEGFTAAMKKMSAERGSRFRRLYCHDI